jgi:hypothetical protein
MIMRNFAAIMRLWAAELGGNARANIIETVSREQVWKAKQADIPFANKSRPVR